jgi:RNA polymerase sigma factor (sigma-70 family)
MPDDAELLRRYAEGKSEEAFAELVRRHLNLVYAVALRQVGGDAHLAQDVAQTVFTALARKAAALARRPVLGGWLYRTTQYAAIDVVRAESRRRAREQEAQTMHENNNEPATAPDGEKLRGVLDHVLSELRDADRDAVVLRFFEGKSYADVGARLRLGEDGARMRVERALEKLRAALGRRGITSTTGALGVALANQVAVAAPAGLAGTVTVSALAGATTGAVGAVVAAFFTTMSTIKTATVITGIIALLAIGTAIYEAVAAASNEKALASARQPQVVMLAKLRDLQTQIATEKNHTREADEDNAKLLRVVDSLLMGGAAQNSPASSGPLTHAAVQARYRHAIELARKGDPAAALKEFLWCFDDGMTRVSTFRIARRGALLDAVAKLGEQYPEALVAMRARRDQAEKGMQGSSYDLDLVADFVALNRALNDTDQTIKQFDLLAADDPRRRAMASYAFDQLATAQRYSDAALARPYAQMTSQFEEAANWAVPKGAPNPEEIRRNSHDFAVNTAATNIEVLAGAGDLAHARELAGKVLAYDSSDLTKAMLQTRFARAGHPELLNGPPGK